MKDIQMKDINKTKLMVLNKRQIYNQNSKENKCKNKILERVTQSIFI